MEEVIKEINEKLNKAKYCSDLSDVGNEIGIVLGKYLSKEDGNTLSDFIHGIQHGISLTNGTH